MSVSSTTLLRNIDDWDTPERRRENEELTPIPNEIYLDIISYFQIPKEETRSGTMRHLMSIFGEHKRDLRSLALVCRFFRSITIPVTFQAIRAQVECHSSSETWAEYYIPKLFDSIEPQTLPFYAYIQECTINAWGSFGRGPSENPFLPSYASALEKMPNVQICSLSAFWISQSLLKSLSGHSKLTSLELDHCTLSREITEAEILAFASSIQLQSLTLYLIGFPLPRGLVHLATNSHLEELRTTWEFIEGLASEEIIPPLRCLKVLPVVDITVLFDFLYRIPTLADLELDQVRWPREAQHPPAILHAGPLAAVNADYAISLSPLPNLRRLTCPSHLGYLLKGPHSLEIIVFKGMVINTGWGRLRDEAEFELSTDFRLLMERPNENLRELHVLPHALAIGKSSTGLSGKWIGDMKSWFPNLRVLDIFIDSHINNEGQLHSLFMAFLDNWGTHDKVTDLSFYRRSLDRRLIENSSFFCDLASVNIVQNYFPNVATLTIGGVRLMSRPRT